MESVALLWAERIPLAYPHHGRAVSGLTKCEDPAPQRHVL